jgi:hypothetical protein
MFVFEVRGGVYKGAARWSLGPTKNPEIGQKKFKKLKF